MKVKRALMNPTPKQVVEETESIQQAQFIQQQPIQSEEQLGFQIEDNKTKLRQLLSTFKLRLRRRNDYLEVSQFWKTPAIPFMIVSFLANILILLVGGIFLFSKLPPEIQTFYDPIEQTWDRQDKTIVIILPIIWALLLVVILRLITSIFRTDKRLSIVIAWVMTVLNILLLIAISQIWKLNL
jgi:hypothetical protein